MITLETLAAKLDLELRNPAIHVEVTHVASIASVQSGSLVFATDALSPPPLSNRTPPRSSCRKTSSTQMPQPSPSSSATTPTHFARAAQLLRADRPSTGIHPTAVVDSTASVEIRLHRCHRRHRCPRHLGEHTIIGEGAIIGEGVTIGADCHIYPRVSSIRERPSATASSSTPARSWVVRLWIVSDPATGRYIQFPQQGTLVLEDDVEIGANTAIDRGASAETRICRGTKVDNLVHVGHNVRIGHDTVIAAQTGISGSCTVGNNVMLGGRVGMGDHAHIGDGLFSAARAVCCHGKRSTAPEWFLGNPCSAGKTHPQRTRHPKTAPEDEQERRRALGPFHSGAVKTKSGQSGEARNEVTANV